MQAGIISTVANTPLIKLERLFDDQRIEVFAKLESFNPGGSIKDRTASNIVQAAIQRGQLRPGMTVIESSSGNMGIGLAQTCLYYGLKFICVVDPKATKQNIAIMQAYGAIVDMVSLPDPRTGEFLQARIDRVNTLLAQIPDAFWTNQYNNRDNSNAHHRTMNEIVTQMDGRIDYLFCATSTCGTLRGCAEYVALHHLPTQIYGVDAVGSVIFGGHATPRLLPGHGASRRPELFQEDFADHAILVTDRDCIQGCRQLVQRESILAGASSGGVVAALTRVKDQLPMGARCVVIVCDSGERYLDTVYSDSWIEKYFHDLGPLWEHQSSAVHYN